MTPQVLLNSGLELDPTPLYGYFDRATINLCFILELNKRTIKQKNFYMTLS